MMMMLLIMMMMIMVITYSCEKLMRPWNQTIIMAVALVKTIMSIVMMKMMMYFLVNTGIAEAGISRVNGSRPEADQQLVYQPEKAPLEACRGDAVRFRLCCAGGGTATNRH